jgi:hypothetical protein
MKKRIFTFISTKFSSITLAKFISAFITIVFISGTKYCISGGFHLEYDDFFGNVGVGLLGWTVNLYLITWFTDLLNLRGINFNLKKILFELHSIEKSDGNIKEFKIKRFNAMEPDEQADSGKHLDKGKGVDREEHPFYGYEYNKSLVTVNAVSQLDKDASSSTEPPFALWNKVFPGLDPRSIIFPQRINPGPGFNVPGGEVPIRDEICKHIDYNTNILKQFKTMDLEVAIEQRNNNLKLIEVLENKLAFAQNAFAKIPTIPTTEYEFKLKNKIISDLNDMQNNKVRSEARVALLNSRIQFIEVNIDKKI